MTSSTNFFRPMRLLACAAAIGLSGAPATAQAPIIGSWNTEDGGEIAVTQCGAGYCADVASGTYRGAKVARVSGAGPEYSGMVFDPRSGESYNGSLTASGDSMALKGCIMEVFCKTVQRWQRAN